MSVRPLSYQVQTRYFAWKFIWTVPTNYEIFFGQGCHKGGPQGRQGVTQPFFELQTKKCKTHKMYKKLNSKFGRRYRSSLFKQSHDMSSTFDQLFKAEVKMHLCASYYYFIQFNFLYFLCFQHFFISLQIFILFSYSIIT